MPFNSPTALRPRDRRRFAKRSALAQNRRVRHNRTVHFEQLENRRLLATVSIGDAVVIEGDTSPALLDHFAGRPTQPKPLQPFGLAVSPVDNKTYVAGFGSDNVLRYNADVGQFEEFVAADSTSLDNPYSITFSDTGNLFVASHNTHEVLQFDLGGQFLGAFVDDFTLPTGLRFGPDGHLYVGSADSDSIVRFHGTTGELMDRFVFPGSGGLHRPEKFVFGPDGHLYVASHGNSAVMRYQGPGGSDPGAPLPSVGNAGAAFVPSGAANLAGPNSLAFGPDLNDDGIGDLFVSSANTDQVLVYDGSTGTFVSQFVDAAQNGLNTPSDLLFDAGQLAVGSRSTGEVLRFSVSTGELADRLPNRRLPDPRRPRGILLHSDVLYVTNGAANDIQRYDATTGNFIDTFISDADLRRPQGVAIGPDGNVYVSSLDADSVRRYDGTTGSFIDEFVEAGAGGLDGAIDLSFRDGYLYVSSYYSDEILRFDATTGSPDPTGPFITAGSNGLDFPTYFTFDDHSNLLVSSAGTDSILRFDGVSGGPIDQLVTPGLGGLDAPRGVHLKNGMLYVASARTDEILRYNALDGTFIDVYAPASSSLDFPVDLAVAANGTLFVSSRDNDIVARFGDKSTAVFEVSLSEPVENQVAVNFETADGSASAGNDYLATGGTLVFEPGVTSRTIAVRTLDDTRHEPLPGETFSVLLSNATGATIGDGQGEGTIMDDDPTPSSFHAISFTPTSGGFRATLSADLDRSVLSLGDTETAGHGPADVVLTGAATGPVNGSLVVGQDARSIEFLATGTALEADTYTVVLRSADNGLRDTSGNLLDGNSDGVGGDDFRNTFTVSTNTSVVGVQDFVRGPGQDVHLPANSSDGIPITISSDSVSIRNARFAIDYNPSLLAIASVTPGSTMPAGSLATLDTSTLGRAIVTFASPTDLPTGLHSLVNLEANVPADSLQARYGEQHVLDINSISLTNASGEPLPSIDNDGLHVAAFFGDVSGNGGINSSDASQVARVAALLDAGFSEFLLTDPRIVGDISGNGVINATDASMVARHAVELPVDEIPAIAGGVVVADGGRLDAHLVKVHPTRVPRAMTYSDWPRALAASTAFRFDLPVVVRYAVDAVLAGIASPEPADDDELPPGLEGAVEQLLSASLALSTY